MKKRAAMPMRSFDLAHGLAPLNCFVCGASNLSSYGRCNHCAAPLCPVMDGEIKSNQVELISMFGAAHCGKSVYLGMLTDLLARPNSPLPLLLRGAYSVSLQQSTVTALAQCTFPESSTSLPDSWNWLHGQIREPGRPGTREVLAPDISGSWLAEQLDKPKHPATLSALLERSQGAMIFLDASQLVQGDRSGEFLAVKALTHLSEYRAGRGRNKCQVPLAVVFLKCDEAEVSFDDPKDFASQHTPTLVQLCEVRIACWQTFAASVTPACAYEVVGNIRRHVPLRIEPRGVTEPFAWLIGKMRDVKPARRKGWLDYWRKPMR